MPVGMGLRGLGLKAPLTRDQSSKTGNRSLARQGHLLCPAPDQPRSSNSRQSAAFSTHPAQLGLWTVQAVVQAYPKYRRALSLEALSQARQIFALSLAGSQQVPRLFSVPQAALKPNPDLTAADAEDTAAGAAACCPALNMLAPKGEDHTETTVKHQGKAEHG